VALIDIKKDTLIIGTSSSFTKGWLEKHYSDILDAVKKLYPEYSKVEFETVAEEKLKDYLIKINIKKKGGKKIIEKDYIPSLTDYSLDITTNLNVKYTFDNFIVGDHNNLAFAASESVVKNLGTKYNPLFIHGGVGLGKTHLMQATGNAIFNKYKGKKKILYVPSEKLVSDIIKAIHDGTTDDLKLEYKKLDLLLIDDIQFISKKEKTQDVLFHIFNGLYQNNKQIIFTSDKPPKSIYGVEERLKSRFEGGMIVDISAPNFETRYAILKEKMKKMKVKSPDYILTFIADNVLNNVRELEGSLNKVLAVYDVTKEYPSEVQLNKILKDFIKKPQRAIKPTDILKCVCEYYGTNLTEIKGDSRKKDIARSRQIAMFLIKKYTNMSYPKIAEVFNKKDHTTIMHAFEKISKGLKQDTSLINDVDTITSDFFRQVL
jgi:chromosomal replication initiator protein